MTSRLITTIPSDISFVASCQPDQCVSIQIFMTNSSLLKLTDVSFPHDGKSYDVQGTSFHDRCTCLIWQFLFLTCCVCDINQVNTFLSMMSSWPIVQCPNLQMFRSSWREVQQCSMRRFPCCITGTSLVWRFHHLTWCTSVILLIHVDTVWSISSWTIVSYSIY